MKHGSNKFIFFLCLILFFASHVLASVPPTFQATGSVANGAGSITPTWPSHQIGDVALLIVETDTNQNVTLSSNDANFAQITNSPQNATGTKLTVFWTRATSSSMNDPTVADSGNHQIARIITFRGVITSGNPWDVTSGDTSASNASFTIPGATTTLANTLVVAIVANGTDTTNTQASGWTNNNLTSLTERTDVNTNSGNGGGFSVATGIKATAGNYGNTIGTLATASTQARISLALKPALPTITISDANLIEGNTSYSNMNFTVTLSEAANASVQYSTSSGTATAGSDYTEISGILTFNNETTKTIFVPIIGDTLVEQDETFSLTLSNPVGATITTATATGTILNDDLPTIHTGEREFTIRNPITTRNIKGGLQVIGNTVLCVPQTDSWGNIIGGCYNYTGNSSNSELNLQYIDGDGVTRNYNNSSQALLNIPSTAKIKWAGLYSQGYLNNNNSTQVATTLQDPIYVTIPSIGTITSVPEIIDLYNNSNDGYTYDTFAPLPALIGQTGASVNGWITGANIKADTGTENSGLGNFGAWTLAVVYEESSSTLKNISVFDGYKRVANADGFRTVNIPISGFLTPTSGSVQSTLSLFVGEGDKNIAGDQLYVNGTAINSTNAFYSTMNGFTANPSYSNTQGIDIQNHNIGVDGDTSHLQIIGNGQKSSTITLTSTQDTYFPSMVAFTTELYEPRVCYVEAYYDADGNATLTTAKKDDIIMIKTWIANMKKDASDGNLETAQKVEITMEHDDTNLAYQTGSTKIQNIGESTYSSKTDAKDSDTATFYSDTNTSIWHIGTGATASDGGDLTPNVTNDAANKVYASFKTKLQTTGDITIANIYKVSYENSNMGLRIGDESPVNIGVCKDFNTSIIVSAPLGVFNVVNENFSGNTNSTDGKSSDNALYTQIAGKPFTVKVLALDADKTTLKAYTGDVNLSLILAPTYTGNTVNDEALCNNASASTSNTPIAFNNENMKTISYSFPNALQNVAFRVGYNSGGTTKYVCSRDSFAIRPLSYKMDANETHLVGSKPYRLTIQSVQNDKTTKATYYDQAITTNTTYKSASIDLNIPTDCNGSTLSDKTRSFTPLTLTGGEVIDNNFSYPNVGDVNVTIFDNDWTIIDQSRQNGKGYSDCIEDSNTSIPIAGKIGCLIKSIQPFTFSPKQFKNTLALQNFNDGNFTYVSNDGNMSAILLLTPTAILENNATATNYTKKCYARDITYTVELNGTIQDKRNRIRYFEDETTSNFENNHTVGRATFSSTEGNFTSGIATNLKILFNFTRDVNKTEEPFRIARNDFNITSLIDQNNTTGSDFNRTNDQNSTFYYGRVYSTDYKAPSPIDTTIRYEVYCTQNCGDFNLTQQSPTSLRWYQNPLHVNVDGNVTTNGFSSIGTTLINNADTETSGNIVAGIESNTLRLPNATPAPYTDRIRMTPSTWLVFNPFNANATTNDFNVEFITQGNWAGQGSLGRTVDVNTSTRTNRRMEW